MEGLELTIGVVVATAERDGDMIAVTTEYRDSTIVRMVPGARYKSADHVWHVPLSWSACLVLQSLFTDRLSVGPQLSEWATRHQAEFIEPALALRESLSVSDETPSPYLSLLDELLMYQKAGV